MIRSMKKRLNKALPALLLGIVLYGLLVQFIGVWFVKDKLLYSTGLWIGIAMAMGMAIHIAVVIEDAIALNGENHAKNKIVAWSLLRYMIVVIIFFVTLKFRLGNVLMEFVGVMGLKAAAYLQPFIHRVLYGSDGGMLSGLDSVLFGRKSVSIISHRIEDIKALQAFVTCINVAGNVSQRVSHMQSCSRWIREHIKHVEFLF